jgi:hypothetical protein
MVLYLRVLHLSRSLCSERSRYDSLLPALTPRLRWFKIFEDRTHLVHVL